MRLLIVDDDPDFRSLLAGSAPPGLEPVECGSTREAIAALRNRSEDAFALALIDLHIAPFLEREPEKEGLALLGWMRRSGYEVPTILISSEPRLRRREIESHLGLLGFLGKPFPLDRFYRFVLAYHELFSGKALLENSRSSDVAQRGVGAGP